MPGTFAGTFLPCSSGPILIRWARALARLLLDAGPDLAGHGVPSLLLKVGDEADRAGHHRQAPADLPGQSELAGDGPDGARGIYRQRALEGTGRFRGHQLHQADVVAGETVLGRDLEELRHAGIDGLVDRMAEAGDRAPPFPRRGDNVDGELLVGAGRAPPFGEGLLEHSRHLLDRAPEAVAHAQQARGDGALERLGRAQVGEPGRDGAGRHPVLDERDRDRVEDGGLLLRGQPSLQLQEGHVAQRGLADEILDEVMASDHDPVGRAPGQLRAQPLAAAHARLVRLVLYPLAPKALSATSVTRARKLRWDRIASSSSGARAGSWRRLSGTST